MGAATILDISPAILKGQTGREEAFALLDDPQFWSSFGRQLEKTGEGSEQREIWESRLLIEGMHCAACALNVEDALRKVPGVQEVSVSAGGRHARLRWDAQHTKPSQWRAALQRAGYDALPAQHALAGEQRRKQTRRALWRWLVAGFCMMQVMMYAWPAYVAEPGDLTVEQEQILRWASWVISLPVMLFCCAPFFKAAWRDLVNRRLGMDLPVALGMAITFIVSSLGTFEPQGIFGREVYFDSLTMFVFFLLTGRWLEERLHERTAGALDALMNRLPESVLRRRSNERGDQRNEPVYERVAAHRVRRGDVLRVLPGETFVADGVILEGATQVDEALLTGEAHPLGRGAGMEVIAGSHNLVAPVLVRVTHTGKQTRFAQIVGLMEEAAVSRPRIAQLVDRLARPFLAVVLLAAFAAAAYWWNHDAGGPGHALMVAVAVLIVTCPCALALATPAAMLASAGALARRGVLVRRPGAFEPLASVDTVVFDKTGTLTGDALILQAVRSREGVSREYALGMAAALARHSLHPLSRAIVAAAGLRREAWDRLVTDAKDVEEKSGLGLSGVVNGRALKLGSAALCGITVQGAQGPQAHLADAQGWLATFEFGEELRADARETVQTLQERGLDVRILSGDAPGAVARVAAQLGLVSQNASGQGGQRHLDDPAQGGCAPQDKLDLLRRLQEQDHKVAVVGDGLNDGPALAGAQVSFAFGRAVPLARAQSDFVVLGDQLGNVACTHETARRTMRIVRQNLAWAAAYNAACVPLAVLGWLPAWVAGLGMALSSLLVVGNAMRLAKPGKAV